MHVTQGKVFNKNLISNRLEFGSITSSPKIEQIHIKIPSSKAGTEPRWPDEYTYILNLQTWRPI